jgi:hypothetical protein
VEIPNTTVECDGCGEELNLLAPHLAVQVKPKRKVLLLNELPDDDPNAVPEEEILVGEKSGRGVLLTLHDFDCLSKWTAKRKGKPAKLEFHVETEVYVPADNRSPEELAEAEGGT